MDYFLRPIYIQIKTRTSMIYQNQYTQCLLIMRKTLLYKPVSKQLIGGTEKEENSGEFRLTCIVTLILF